MSKSLLCGSLSLAAPHCARGVGTHSYINLPAPFPVFPNTYLWLSRSIPPLFCFPLVSVPSQDLPFLQKSILNYSVCVCLGWALVALPLLLPRVFSFFKLHECSQNGNTLILDAQVKKQSITRIPGLPLDSFSHFLPLNSWLPLIWLLTDLFCLFYHTMHILLCLSVFVQLCL